MSYYALQQYWWVIISLLGGILVFLLFVQGGQTLIYSLGKTEKERSLIVNVLGRKWEFTFTTLVTFGGAFFASFPLFYATSFGGAYWLWMLILFCFIVQAVAYEYRSKPNNIFGLKTYEFFLLINGTLGTFLLGVAVATFFSGAGFTVDDLKHSSWSYSFHGLELILNVENITLGLSVFFLSRVLALLYFISSIDHPLIFSRIKRRLWFNSIPFLIFFLTFCTFLLTGKGYAYSSVNEIITEPFKYFHNFIAQPLILILFAAGVLLVLGGIIYSLAGKGKRSFWLSGTGTVLTVFSLFLCAGLNHTCFYPSVSDVQSSLNIENSSSSKYTLTAMSWVSILLPFVFAYIFYAWRAMNKSKINEEELDSAPHVY
jgi:cytochrome d ubiquinol oxidase subunit II